MLDCCALFEKGLTHSVFLLTLTSIRLVSFASPSRMKEHVESTEDSRDC
jgi:hypothetical protein